MEINNVGRVGVVGMGRTGTTIVREILKNLYYQDNNKSIQNNFEGNVKYRHWYRPGDENMADILIMCRRDLRDSLASCFRDCDKYNSKDFTIKIMDNPYPSDFKVYKKYYGVPANKIIEMGKQLITEGFFYWEPHVDYIFHYEAYMENPQKIVQELANQVKIKNPDVSQAIKATKDWLHNHPNHSSPSKGKSNSWHDIFSPAQEKIIIDHFGYYLRNFNYIQ